jgi:hypothetical protein
MTLTQWAMHGPEGLAFTTFDKDLPNVGAVLSSSFLSGWLNLVGRFSVRRWKLGGLALWISAARRTLERVLSRGHTGATFQELVK